MTDMTHTQPGGLVMVDPDALAAAAQAHTDSLRPANSTAAYAQDWATWVRYCRTAVGSAGCRVDPLAVTSAMVTAYAYWLWHVEGAPIATARRRLTGLVVGLRARLGEDAVPHGLTRQARANLTAYQRDAIAGGQRRRGRERGQATAVTVDMLRAMVDTCDTDTLTGLRDRALLLIGLSIAGRRAEVAGLRVADIEVSADGLTVRVLTTKLASSRRTVVLPRLPRVAPVGPMMCPARAWETWADAAGLTADDPAFLPLTKWGTVRPARSPMSPAAAGAVVTRRGEAAGIEARLTGHGLRRGLATESRRAGHDRESIARQGGWAPGSRDLSGYIDMVDAWGRDNATTGVLG